MHGPESVQPAAKRGLELELEGQLQTHLNQAGFTCRGDSSERGIPERGTDAGKAGPVERVEEFCPVLQPETLVDLEVLADRKIRDRVSRTGYQTPPRIAERVGGRLLEGGLIEPLGNRPRAFRVSDQVRSERTAPVRVGGVS